MKKILLICFLLFWFLPGFNQVNQYLATDSIKEILAKRDSFTLVYHVKYYYEKDASEPQDSFDVIYIKTGNNYIAKERNAVVICEESNCILISENDQTVYFQNYDRNIKPGNTVLQIDPLLAEGIITEVELEGKKYYKLTSTEIGSGSVELYLSYDKLIPEKMIAESAPQFASVDGNQIIVFPKTVIQIEYYPTLNFNYVQPSKIDEVILFKNNIISLTPKYNAYELYEL